MEKFLPFCVCNSPIKNLHPSTVTPLSTVKENNNNYTDLPAWSSVCDAAVWCLACWTSLSSGRSSGGGAGGHTRWGDWPRPSGDREGSLLEKKRSRVIKRFNVKQKVELIFFFFQLTTISAIEDTGSTAAPSEKRQRWRHQPVDDAALPWTQCKAAGCR